MDGSIAIGIDLGTTHSCVAVMRYGKIEIIANEQGYFVTPSYVAFNEHEILVGDAAKKQVDMNPENTVFDSKRLIGRKFADPIVQQDMKHWPFTVRDVNSEPRIEITYNGEKRLLAPEEISAMILTKLKEMAESYLNEEVKDAVITVPAYFNNGQRQATKDAAQIAGLNVLQILNEPTAAAIAFNFKERFNTQRGQPNILVYDLGGGTFDVSVMNGIRNSVVASTGDTHLGGSDFDCRLVNHCVQEFKRKFKIDLQDNRRAMSRLRNACEVAKRELSSATDSQICLYALCDGRDFALTVLRAKFEHLNAAEFKKTIDSVQVALNDAKLSKEDIDVIILAGGSTRIPMIQKTLQSFFGDKFIEKSINPDEAVAYGAAVHAAYLKGNYCAKICGSVLQDITPLSLGLDLYENDTKVTIVVIPRNTPIPAKGYNNSVTMCDNQKSSKFTVRQGESPIPQLNYQLGDFVVSDLPKGPAGSVKFTTVFNIDANGILTVNSVEKSTGNSNGIVIDNVSGHLRKQEVENMIRVAQQFRREQRLRQDAARAKVALADECYSIMDKCMLDTDGKYQKCAEILGWLEENPHESADSYKKRFNELATLS